MIQDYGENEFPSGENFECSECHKMFKYESHFSRHILTHSDQRPYACGSCGKKFKRQDALKTHERTHSDDLPFKCSQAECLERFASKAALRYHELRHANQSEFICDIDGCNKKFLTLGQLKQHQRTKIHSKSVQIQNGEIRIQDNQVDSIQRQQSQSQLSSNPPQQSGSVNIQFPNDLKNSSQLLASSSVAASSLINISGKKRSFEELKQHSIPAIKKEQQNQVEGFLDYFSEDEQAFIDQIWSTIKQENHANNIETDNTHQTNQQIQLNQELQEQSQYLTSKRRHLSSFGQASISQQCSSSHSDLLLEFSRISSSGNSSSFGRLKQELRIIVGLIDKIKKEDQEIFAQDPEESNHGIEPIQRESIKREIHEINQEDNGFNNNNQSYHDNQRQNSSFDSQEPQQNEEINDGLSESPKQNFQFYQHDESPFHDYDCQFLHKSIPSEIVNEINQEDCEDKTMDSSKLLNRPLLKRKIKTAVRLVQYCKKVFLDERKQAIQQEQQLRRQQELLQQQKREQQEKQQQQQQQQIQEMNLQKLFAQSSQFSMKQHVLMQAPWNNSASQVLVQENMNFPENSNSQFFSGDDQSVFFQDCFNPLNSQIMNSCQLGRQNSLNLSMNPIIQRNSSQINQGINQQQLIHQIAPANQQQFFQIKNMNNFNNLNHAIQQQPQISYSQIIPSLSGLSNISSSIQSSIPSLNPLNNNLSPSCHPSPSRSDNSLRLCMSSEVEGGSHINREPMQFGNIFDAADEIGSINQDYAFLEELASFNACMQGPSPINDPTRNM